MQKICNAPILLPVSPYSASFTGPNLATVGRIVAIAETLLPPCLMPLLAAYVLHCCGESWRESALFRAVLACMAVLSLLLCAAQFTEGVYYFTADNRFVRGAWYPLLIVPMIAMIVVNLVGVLRRRRKLSKKLFVAFLVFLLPPLLAMFAQAFRTVFLLIVIAVTISALSMLGIVLADQVEQYLRQQREISNQRARTSSTTR